jgi:hypothetical protein
VAGQDLMPGSAPGHGAARGHRRVVALLRRGWARGRHRRWSLGRHLVVQGVAHQAGHSLGHQVRRDRVAGDRDVGDRRTTLHDPGDLRVATAPDRHRDRRRAGDRHRGDRGRCGGAGLPARCPLRLRSRTPRRCHSSMSPFPLLGRNPCRSTQHSRHAGARCPVAWVSHRFPAPPRGCRNRWVTRLVSLQ